MPQILIAEDESRIAAFVAKGLRSAGYRTTIADNGETALLLGRSGTFDLLLLDLGLPRMSGLEVLERLHSERCALPVIVVTARDSATEDVMQYGALECLTKPVTFATILASVKQHLTKASKSDLITAGGLILDRHALRATDPSTGLVADLTPRELAFLELLLVGEVVTREQLLNRLWGTDYDPTSNVVEVFVKTLRRKLGPDRIISVAPHEYRLATA